MDGLESVVQMIVDESLTCELWVDGSFLTEKIEPRDVDIVFVFTDDVLSRASSAGVALLNRFFDSCSKNAYKEQYYCDVYVAADQRREYWRNLFGFSRAKEPKGLPVILLPHGEIPKCS